MRSNEEIIAPVNHTAGSAIGSTAAGAAGGALKSGVKTWLGVMGAGIVGGALVGLMFATGGAAGIAWGTVAWIMGGATVGGLLAAPLSLPLAGVGGAVGAFTGGARANNRVRDERGAAAVVDAQIAMARAQNPAPAATTVYAPSASNNTHVGAQPGERGNRVTTNTVHAANDNAAYAANENRTQHLGTISGAQLAAAR